MDYTQVFDNFTRLYRPYIKYVTPILEHYDLHTGQWLVLKDIGQHDQTTLVDISKRRFIEKPTTRKILKALIEKDYVCMTPGEDKRKKLLSLTSEGQHVHHEVKNQIATVQAELISKSKCKDGKLETVVSVLDKLYQELKGGL
ncbi:winged helix DNA-binding protein [Staphylococcus massiliensis]|uniref:MarR family winged helix-turn-helix transcriptional regulator n=1 Tax=Staphylococcus massiliensis TaxID=555791 RepID=UPI001EDEDB24|nr:winged helix DNA-binding protein [Staphylococcus massiliensis]MCG3402519.1 winged helix DNA-binding protein [Staphylococcus massiliensis]